MSEGEERLSYTARYANALRDAAIECKEMYCPEPIWEQRAAEVFNKHLRPLFQELVKSIKEQEK